MKILKLKKENEILQNKLNVVLKEKRFISLLKISKRILSLMLQSKIFEY